MTLAELKNQVGQDIELIEGKVSAVYPQKTFNRKDGSTGSVQNILIEDDTGKIRCVLWDRAELEVFYVGQDISIQSNPRKKGNVTYANAPAIEENTYNNKTTAQVKVGRSVFIQFGGTEEKTAQPELTPPDPLPYDDIEPNPPPIEKTKKDNEITYEPLSEENHCLTSVEEMRDLAFDTEKLKTKIDQIIRRAIARHEN